MKKFFCVLFLLFFLPFSVHADEVEYSTDGLINSVPDEAKAILEELEIESTEDSLSFEFWSLFEAVSKLFKNMYFNPIKCFFLSVTVIILSSFISALSQENTQICELAGAITICVIYLSNIANIIVSCDNIIDSVNVFLGAAIPIYASLQIAVGNPSVGTNISVIALFTANLFTSLTKNLIIPCLSIFLGLSVSSAFSHVNVKSICNVIYNFTKWVLVLIVTIFSSVISIQSSLSATTDVVATKTIKLLASSAVPIVGKAFGEGITAVQNSIKVLKSGAGAFGIIASFCIFITPITEVLLWIASTQLVLITAELFNYKKVSEITGILMLVLKMILAVLISLCVITMVISAITLFVGA